MKDNNGNFFIYIEHSDLYFVAVTRNNTNALLIIVFL